MVTNEIGNDPDIKTEPVLHFFDRNNSSGYKTHLPLQQVLFLLVLSLLDIYWRFESIMHYKKNFRRQSIWIGVGLVLHYALLASLVWYTPVTCLSLLKLMLAKGFMTAVVVFTSHYPETRLDKKHQMGLFEQTLRTSRNTTGLFFSWTDGIGRRIFNECTGYLSMQVEHHLVPAYPSGNLMLLRPIIKALAAKHGLPYKETSILQALWENILKLSGSSFEELKKL